MNKTLHIVIFKSLLAALLLVSFNLSASAQPKREFRGAWIQCVNGQFLGMGTEKMQKTLTYQLDELQKDGVNAIIFQVRPECDALYQSSIEPWSRFLTGEQGKAPYPAWDPLQWMIDQCHQRGMELHAWINPFRAKTKTTKLLSPMHIAKKTPSAVFEYDDLLILNPALKSNRDYINKVVADIVSRYDVDGLHMDDYFYPYPVAGQDIPDRAYYEANNYGISNIDDWRRQNVNLFIEECYNTIRNIKPWVKFGVSPFGIYRNKKSAPEIGSETNGLQNYDQLYADILFWVNNGWIDYCVPQVYWEIGNKAADYETLIKWWNKYSSNRPLYIGEDVERTVKYPDLQNPNKHQMDAKYALHDKMQNVQGTVLWYAKAVVDNTGNYGTMLRNNYWRYKALQPQMPFIDKTAPKKVRKAKVISTSDGPVIFWQPSKGEGWKDAAHQYVVYTFHEGESINTDSPKNISAITRDNFYVIPADQCKGKTTFIITALDRMSNESKGVKLKKKF